MKLRGNSDFAISVTNPSLVLAGHGLLPPAERAKRTDASTIWKRKCFVPSDVRERYGNSLTNFKADSNNAELVRKVVAVVDEENRLWSAAKK